MQRHLAAGVLLAGLLAPLLKADEPAPAKPTPARPASDATGLSANDLGANDLGDKELSDAELSDAELGVAESAFTAAMRNASLVGGFTTAGEPQAAAPPQVRPERYDLGEVRKVSDGLWLFPTRVRYGGRDVTLPITLPVRWAGDTAVIVVDNVGFPGLGEYSARVLIHDGRYAGYWHGGGRGGHLFGSVVANPPTGDLPADPR